MKRVLFITWDGPQVSYLESLFLPIFSRLLEFGYQFHVLQFTWNNREFSAEREALCYAAGVPYRCVTVNRRLGDAGPFMTAIWGATHIKRAVREWQIDTLMPRSLMPALAVLSMPSWKELEIVFDADGFAVDERADFAGLSRRGATYRILRAVEAKTARLADRVLVRTPRAIDILSKRAETSSAKFHVVGNGRDPTPFLSGFPERTDDEFRICYAGSIGPQYCPGEMLALTASLRTVIPNLSFRIMTRDTSALEAEINRADLSDRSWIRVTSVHPLKMPTALMQCDLGLALRKPAFSTQGVAPIKIGEYLLAGLPIIGTNGIGPVEPAVQAGVMLPIDGDFSYVADWIRESVLPHRMTIRKRAQELGLAHFSLNATVADYAMALA